MSAQSANDPPGGSTPLEGTYWRAIELAGKATPADDAQRNPYLQFDAEGRVFGFDGCNRVTGSFHREGDRVTFNPMGRTQMECPDSPGTETPFVDALTKATRLTRTGDRLELLDAEGTRLAAFRADSKPQAAAPSTGLAGTSWQLVKFESSDDTTLTPNAGAKYTIEFAGDGKLTAQIDCNRGFGTWTSPGPDEIAFGPLALTRMQCPPGSLHDQIVKQWDNIRSYVIRDGHLFLALKLDGGIYEFEPAAGDK